MGRAAKTGCGGGNRRISRSATTDVGECGGRIAGEHLGFLPGVSDLFFPSYFLFRGLTRMYGLCALEYRTTLTTIVRS